MAAGERLICDSSALIDSGDGVCFDTMHRGRREPAFAIRYEGRVYAYLNRCAHMPIELDWSPGKFFDGEGLLLICSSHGALYAPDTGECLGGPCLGGLVALDVEEREGTVVLKESGNGG